MYISAGVYQPGDSSDGLINGYKLYWLINRAITYSKMRTAISEQEQPEMIFVKKISQILWEIIPTNCTMTVRHSSKCPTKSNQIKMNRNFEIRKQMMMLLTNHPNESRSKMRAC